MVVRMINVDKIPIIIIFLLRNIPVNWWNRYNMQRYDAGYTPLDDDTIWI